MKVYKKINAHPRVTLRLPESLKKSNYVNITSAINHISPGTIGEEKFYKLVSEYTKLYSQLNPEIWSNEFVKNIFSWCKIKQPKGDPAFFTSYTVGQKTL